MKAERCPGKEKGRGPFRQMVHHWLSRELPTPGLSCRSGRVTRLPPGWNLASHGDGALGTFSWFQSL